MSASALQQTFVSPTEAALRELATETAFDPGAFIWMAFPWGQPGPLENEQPREWLLDVCASIKARLIANEGKPVDLWDVVSEAVASGHGIGKSAGMAKLILWAMSTAKKTRGVVTANTETQLRTTTWPELAKWHSLCLFRSWFTITATAIYRTTDPANWRIDAKPWSEHNTEAFQGLHNKGKRLILCMDEASGIPDLVWEVAEGAMTDAATQIIWLAFGNPTRSAGRFRQCWTKFRDIWSVRNVDSRSVKGAMNRARIEKWRLLYGENSQFFKVRVKGEFVEAEANQLIALQWIADARMRGYQFSPDGSIPRKRLSVDVASGGEDSSIFTEMHHYDSARHLVRQTEASYDVARGATESAKAATNIFQAMLLDAVGPCDIVVDAVGVGDGCAGNLIADDKPVIVYKGGEQAADPTRFRNMRVQCYYLLRNDLRDGKLAIAPDALPDEEAWIEFEEQLCSVRSKPGTEKLEDLETKEEMLRRGVKSPDRADSLAEQYVSKSVTRLASQSAPQLTQVHVVPADFGQGYVSA